MENKEDYINIGLILVSCFLAFMLPFELFLFSYAVLGPLHYLTEISWLHQRNYFSTGKKDYMLLIVLCFVISFAVVMHDGLVSRKYFGEWFVSNGYEKVLLKYMAYIPVLIFTALIGSFGLVYFKKISLKLLSFGVGVILGYLLLETKFNTIFVGIFVPTLVHVYVFTALFMLYGALKNRSIPGFISVLFLIGCAFLFYLIQYVPAGFSVTAYVKKVILETGFTAVNVRSLALFKTGVITEFDVFGSRRGLMIQRFIAFAYTYHYLNWFSKTEVIKWHKVPKKWLIGSVAIWIASMALYYYNYKSGLIALFFLSLLHVFLEFPLNVRSFIGIFDEVKNLIFMKKSSTLKQ